MHWKSTVNKTEYQCNKIFTNWNFFLFRYENNIYKIEAQIQSKKRIKIKKNNFLKIIFFFLSLLNIFYHKLSNDDPIN